jgi:tetratricopeptide (TPR) repeat protein
MKTGQKILLAFVVFAMVGSVATVFGARSLGRLFVTIKDTDGKPMQDVKITMVSSVTAVRSYELEPTDKRGRTRITGLEPEAYNMTIEKEGYETRELTVSLRPGVNMREEYTLMTEEEAYEERREKVLGEMTEEERNRVLAEEAHNKGLEELDRGDLDAAKKQFEKAIELNPDIHYATYLVLGQMAFDDQDVENAYKYLSKAYEMDEYKEGIADIGSLLGATYMIKGDLENAKKIWTEEIKYELNPLVLFNLAGLEVREGDLDAAAEWLKKSVENFPDHFDSLRLLGDIYINQGDYPNALKMYEKMEKLLEGYDDVPEEQMKDTRDTVKLLREMAEK